MSEMFSKVRDAVPASTPLSAEASDAPAMRLLRAVEAIAAKGPLTHDDLRRMLGISKTATWRIVTTLREAGWVRIVHGGRFIKLDCRLDDLFATAPYSDREFAPVTDLLGDVAESYSVHVDLFTMAQDSSPVLVETTRRLTHAMPGLVEPDENLMLALEGAMTPIQLTRHFSRRLETADPQAAMAIRSGDAGRRVRQMLGFVWSLDGSTLTVSLRGGMGTPAALRISPRTRKTDRSVYRTVFLILRDRLSGLLESFGRDDHVPL